MRLKVSIVAIFMMWSLSCFCQIEKRSTAIKVDVSGSWQITEVQYLYPDTTYIRNTIPYGRFIFDKNRYALMYNPVMMERTPFKNLSKPEDAELIEAFRSIVFNSGSYVIEDDVVHTTADLAKVPGFEGGQQFYRIERVEDNLQLVMYDETYPDGNKPEWYGKVKVSFLLMRE